MTGLEVAGPERVGHWLYPLTGTGRRITTTTGSFAADHRKLRSAALAGTVREGSGPFERGFLTVADGDLLWLLDSVGVVGLARVVGHTGRPSPSVTFRIERGPTRVLAHDPVPSTLLGRWLRSTLRQPMELSHDHILTEGLVWWLDQLDARDKHRLEPIGVTSLRSVSPRGRERLDDPTVAATVRALRARDLAIGLPTGKSCPADLVARNGDRLVVARIVHEPGERGRRIVLAALGGLAWYGRGLAEQATRLDLRPDLWLVFAQAPSEDLVRFLEEDGRSVAWQEDAELRLGPSTAARWPVPSTTRSTGAPSKPHLVVARPATNGGRAGQNATADGHRAWADHLGELDDREHDRVVPTVRVTPRDEAPADPLHRKSG